MDVNNILREWPYRWYGLWKSGGLLPDGELPPISNAIDQSWNPEDKSSLVEYLRQSPGVYGTALLLPCLLCTTQLPRWYQSDNVWVWHHSLAHYVAEHHVVLPNVFTDHIRAQNYVPPEQLNVDHWHLPWPESWHGARKQPLPPIPKAPGY